MLRKSDKTNVVKLVEYAETLGVAYLTAYRWFKAGKLKNAFSTETGSIFVRYEKEEDSVPEPVVEERIVIYSRVSNANRRSDLQYQVKRCSDYCAAKGYKVDSSYYEVASGMNDTRRELWKMLDSNPTKIVIENKDRLTRFGFEYLNRLLQDRGCEIEVMNLSSSDEQDLIKDLVSVITSFCCRLYGLRRTKRKVDAIKAIVYDDKSKEDFV